MSNGVRQGGILSQYLFNVNSDDLSAALTKCHTGYCIGDMNINHLMYADDMVVFSPSSVGLRELLSVCETYGLNHEVKFNHKKSAILINRRKYMKNVCHLAFKLNGEDIKEVKSVNSPRS